MKILVTGGNGFLGRQIILGLMARGHVVRSLARSSQTGLGSIGVRTLTGDITDPRDVRSACAGVDAVFHVAANAGIWGSWDSYFQPNVVGTRNVLSACRVHRIKYLIHTSTPSVVFNRGEFHGEDESIPYGRDWLCHYAHTKRIAEEEVLRAHDPDGLKTIALRPHLIWGTDDPHIIPRILGKARAGKLRIIGDGENLVDITHVENAALAHLKALEAMAETDAGGKAYFISQGQPVKLWEWVNTLLEGLRIRPVDRKISLKNAYRLGYVMEKTWQALRLSGEPPMTRFVALQMGKSHYFSINAAREDLGYEPAVTTEEGLERMIAYMRTNPHDRR